MISRLRGIIWEKEPDRTVLDVNGVGYEVLIATSTAAAMGEVGDQAELFISTQVREDSLQLFGFMSAEERQLFFLLIGVNGIGPKTALAGLSAVSPAEFIAAVAAHDVARLTRLPGVGKKTAERILIDLQDKLDPLRAALGPLAVGGGGMRADVIAALVGMGYSRDVADRAVAEAAASATTVEGILKAALQRLGGNR